MQKIPIRGRVADQRVLDSLLRRGSGSLLIRGEPGAGKSTLLRHVSTSFRPAGLVLQTAGLAEEAALPYAALHRLLQPLDGLPPLVERAISGGGCPPELRQQLSTAVLRALAAAGPTVCCVDDAHLLDPASADTLGFVARRVGPHRIVVVFTAAGDGGGVPGVPVRWISGLAAPEARSLLDDLVAGPAFGGPGGAGLPSDVAGALVDLARGNPQALVDLAGSLTPAQRRGEAPLPRGLPLDSALRRAYRSRLALLPPDTRWLLLLAAADDRLDAGELVRAAEASGTDLAALAPAELCGLLRVHGDRLVFPQPMARSVTYDEAPMGQRQAAHQLLAETLDRSRHRLRCALHRTAGAAEPTAADGNELAAAAAAPALAGGQGVSGASTDGSGLGGPAAFGAAFGVAAFGAAGSPAGAVEAWERAAELSADPALAAVRLVAAARLAWTAGQPHRARMLLRLVPHSPTGAASGGPAAEGAAGMAVAVAELLAGEIELRAGAPAGALRTLLAAADRLTAAAPAPGFALRSLALRALAFAGDALCYAGDHARLAAVACRAAALAAHHPEPAALFLTGMAAMLRGHHLDATRDLRRAVELAATGADPAVLTWAATASLLLADDAGADHLAGRAAEAGDVSARPRALELRAYAEYWLGRLDTAHTTALDGLHEAQAAAQDNTADTFAGFLAVLAARRGEEADCRRYAALATRRPSADLMNRPQALSEWALALLDLAAGRVADAAARIGTIADPGTGRGQLAVFMMAAPDLAEAEAELQANTARPAAVTNRAAETDSEASFYTQWAAATGDPLRRALAARCLALAHRRGSAEAADHYREALRLHRAAGNDFERARTELLFGRAHSSRPHLRSALATFERLGLATFATKARHALNAGPAAETETLTAQQLLIARMVAAGATNREVAERLRLSTRTVDHHMRNIFVRLGIRSRIELAKRCP